ncbi:MAG: hypothetical protein QUS12_11850 [Methanosarcina sp.]|nr:hypothetical protein [Methanosarcina sp.]
MSRIYSKMLVTGISIALFLFCTSFNLTAEEEKVEEREQVGKADSTDKSVKSDQSDNSDNAANAADKDSLMERIDFGNSYILGQSIKSGAVYLLHRKQSNIKSMLKTRDDYRKEILEDLKVSEKSK